MDLGPEAYLDLLVKERQALDIADVVEPLTEGRIVRLDSKIPGEGHASTDFRVNGDVIEIAFRSKYSDEAEFPVEMSECPAHLATELLEEIAEGAPFVTIDPEQTWFEAKNCRSIDIFWESRLSPATHTEQ